MKSGWREIGAREDGYRTFGTAKVGGKLKRSPSPPRGMLIRVINKADIIRANIDVDQEAEIAITNSESIASYNWLISSLPTIVVPGTPPAWTPPMEARKLKPDDGNYYRDANAARWPKHPLEPAVRAILYEQPNLDTRGISLFACTSTMGHLLRFLLDWQKPFRFFVEEIGETVFFTRRENSPTEFIADIIGYGHAFPESYTSWEADVGNSSAHQRLIKYDLGNIRCVIRSSCDGFFQDKCNANPSSATSVAAKKEHDVSDLLTALLVGPGKVNASQKTNLLVQSAGRHISQAAIFDIKTRAAWKQTDVLNEEIPRFWVAQIPYLVHARHVKGLFNNIEIVEVADKVRSWEQTHQTHLRALVALLREVLAAVHARKDKKLEICYIGGDSLELREQASHEHDTLPEQLRETWRNSNQTNLAKISASTSPNEATAIKD